MHPDRRIPAPSRCRSTLAAADRAPAVASAAGPARPWATGPDGPTTVPRETHGACPGVASELERWRALGFVTMVGRPNVGKSSLVNTICGEKVSIVSDKPQTTRHRVRGVLTRPDAQLVFVDTPGLHKPVTALGRKVNATAIESVDESTPVDVVCLVLDATAPFGDGDRWVAGHLDLPRASSSSTRSTSPAVSGCWPSSARPPSSTPRPTSRCRRGPVTASTALVEHLVARLPEGPAFFPTDTVRDVPDEQWVAELVREQLLAVTRDELPYSIATRVSEWEGDRITVEIIVERESQKGMVIGRGGLVLKQVGRARPPAAARGHAPDAAGEGRQGLAAPPRPRRPPVLSGVAGRPSRRRRRRGRRRGRRRSVVGRRRLGACAAATRSRGASTSSPGSLCSPSPRGTRIGSPSRVNCTWPMPGG